MKKTRKGQSYYSLWFRDGKSGKGKFMYFGWLCSRVGDRNHLFCMPVIPPNTRSILHLNIRPVHFKNEDVWTNRKAFNPLRLQCKLNTDIQNKWELHQELSHESERADFSCPKSASATPSWWRDLFIDITAVDKIRYFGTINTSSCQIGWGDRENYPLSPQARASGWEELVPLL